MIDEPTLSLAFFQIDTTSLSMICGHVLMYIFEYYWIDSSQSVNDLQQYWDLIVIYVIIYDICEADWSPAMLIWV